ncbi:MAG: FAD-dependent oxidoreductase, partial [Kiritimatiellae bacterium]|nr:FAD-dependent oxidoreductase [Kiritimatiellia bacterium]
MNRRAFVKNLGCIAACGAVTGGAKAASPAATKPVEHSGGTLKAEVCVVGGGPAGFVAAIAAARHGARVVLVESFGFPGGMATAGLVGPISKFNFAGKRVVEGLPWKFVERLAARGG